MRRLYFLAFPVVLALSACGGGGSDSCTQGASSPSNNFPPQVPLTYSGVTTGAALIAFYFFFVQNEAQVFRSSGVQVFRPDTESAAPTPEHPNT